MANQVSSEHHHTLPRRNVEWLTAIVKWTRYDYVVLYDYPTIDGSDVLIQIYPGDMVEVSRKYRRNDWCLCQVGHQLGWVFLKDVRFLVRGAPPVRPARQPKPPRPVIETPAVAINTNDIDTAIPDNPYQAANEADTQPAPRSALSADKKPLIERLIKFFKK